MSKTASFGVMHLATAFGVTYLLTGNAAVAGAVTFVEPAVNTVLHYFHDKHWDRVEARLKGQIAALRHRFGSSSPAPTHTPRAGAGAVSPA